MDSETKAKTDQGKPEYTLNDYAGSIHRNKKNPEIEWCFDHEKEVYLVFRNRKFAGYADTLTEALELGRNKK